MHLRLWESDHRQATGESEHSGKMELSLTPWRWSAVRDSFFSCMFHLLSPMARRTTKQRSTAGMPPSAGVSASISQKWLDKYWREHITAQLCTETNQRDHLPAHQGCSTILHNNRFAQLKRKSEPTWGQTPSFFLQRVFVVFLLPHFEFLSTGCPGPFLVFPFTFYILISHSHSSNELCSLCVKFLPICLGSRFYT